LATYYTLVRACAPTHARAFKQQLLCSNARRRPHHIGQEDKLSPTASNVPDIFHISDRLCSNSCLILQTAAAAACQSALIRDIFHIGDRLCSTLARDFNVQLLLPPTQVSFKKYSTLAKECAQTLARAFKERNLLHTTQP
jgi:hypothetical protein